MYLTNNLNNFCADELWLANTTWNSVTPRLTKCLGNVGLTIAPSILFGLLSLFELKFTFSSPNKRIRLNGYNVIRLLICLLGILSSSVLLGSYLSAYSRNANSYSLSDLVASLCKVFVFILLAVIFHFHRINGVITSGIIFFSTLLLSACSSLVFLDSILFNQSMYSDFEASNSLRTFLCSLSLFALSWFTDNPVDAGVKPSEDGETLLENIEQHEGEESEVRSPVSPLYYCSFISKLTFTWYLDLVWKASKKELKFEEIYDVPDHMKIGPNIRRFGAQYQEELERIEKHNQRHPEKKKRYNMFTSLRLIWRNQGSNIVCLGLLNLSADVLIFSQPLLLSFMIDYINEEDKPKWHGGVLVIGIILTGILASILDNLQGAKAFGIGLNLGTNFENLIFCKSLRLSSQARNKRTTGQITNIFSIDAYQFCDFSSRFTYLISFPIQLVLGFGFLFYYLGNAAFISLFIVALIMISQYWLNHYQDKFVTEETKINDVRISLLSEALSGMKIIKLYGWEKPFMERITNERIKQIACNRKFYYLQMLVNWLFVSFTPFMMLSATLAAYIFLVGGEFTEKAFVIILVFKIMNAPIIGIPSLIAYFILARNSLRRVSNFLSEKELERYVSRDIVSRDYDDRMALTIEKAKFVWKKDEEDEIEVESDDSDEEDSTTEETGSSEIEKKPFELNDIELEVGKGEFIAVIGMVGSGKSSLMSAILGEMHLVENDSGEKGRVNISAEQDICYVPQQAWIQNDSFKGNILFSKPFNREKYEQVLDACCLEADLKQFEAGDLTEIGEKGINLSGGQKQRVSLARACYSSILIGDNRQIILLDDVLSAVDAHVGKSICENVLSSRTGLLKNTTRILVTNQLNQLVDLDLDQIVLLKDGRIALKCSYDELLEMERKGELDEYNLRLAQNQKKDETLEEDKKPADTGSQNSEDFEEQKKKYEKDKATLIEKEKRGKGRVKLKNYLTYLQNFGKLYGLLVLFFLILENFFQVYSRVYLATWTETKLNTTEMSPADIKEFHKSHLLIFVGLASLDSVFDIVFNLFMALGIMRTLKLFHEKLLHKVLRAPMSFFDTTPLGRIINRFSKDMEVVDAELPFAARELTAYLLSLFASFAIILYSQPNSLIFYVFIFAIFYWIMQLFINVSRQIRRWETTKRSPIYSHLGESLAGISTIRAYQKVDEMIELMQSKQNDNNRCYWYFISGNKWLNIYLEMLTSLVVLVVTVQFILQKESTSASEAGLLLSYALNLTSELSRVISSLCSFETEAVAIERIVEYCENEEEDAWVKEHRPDADWPKNGEIEFIDYSTRYRVGTNLVLKDLNFKVNGTEKVGVVGRTGAGKSSMTLALFRIIEPASGRIVIDGVDISQIGLHDLKSRLSIIPQDPVLFTGTIRFNLDPFNNHSDEEIYRSLEHAHLRDYVNSLEDGIQHQIAEGGENLSVGQRQLICLARALLRKSKILVLDEATASVDFATDELVQNTIRSEFSDCTTITIAHRLKTVLDSSRILVLEKGELEEYDTPERLLKNPKSSFYSLALKANVI